MEFNYILWYTEIVNIMGTKYLGKGGINMTEDLIKEVKHIQKCLVNKESEGEEWEEKMQIVRKLEEVADYLKDALGKGIEF